MNQIPNAAELWIDTLKEFYRRNFTDFAAEQLYISGTAPGEFLKFNHLTRGQSIIHSLVEEQRARYGWIRIVVIKGRQLGASTYFAARAYHMASLNRMVSTMLLAHSDETAKTIFEKCKTFYYHVADEIRPLARKDNREELAFENPDSRTRGIYAGLESKMTFRHAKDVLSGTGTTQHFLHLSEAAKYKSDVCNILESSVMPSMHLRPGTVAVNESTAFIGGDYFRNCCERAMSGKSEWIFCFVPWYLEREEYALPLEKGEKLHLDDREKDIIKIAKRGNKTLGVPSWEITQEQLKWRRLKIAGMEDGEVMFEQEYPTTYEEAWVTLDLNVFNRKSMDKLRGGLKNPERCVEILPGPKMVRTDNTHVAGNKTYCAIWKEPVKGRQYDMGVDTSIGIEGGDWSVAEIFDRETREQVCEFHVMMDGLELAEKLYWLGIYYNTAQIGIEMASSGFAINAGLQRLMYPYLYIWRHRERSFPTLSTYTGWKTARDSKQYMLTMMKDAVNKGPFTVHSHVLWNEMYNYIRVASDDPAYDQYRGGNGFNDDCVMATAIGIVINDDETMGINKSLIISEPLSRADFLQAKVEEGLKNLYTAPEYTQRKAITNVLQHAAKERKGWDI